MFLMCGAFCENSFWKINAFAHFLTFLCICWCEDCEDFQNERGQICWGKQILRLQENKTLPLEEGKGEGKEEDSNPFDNWYIEK
jgi:hypothetical protein